MGVGLGGRRRRRSGVGEGAMAVPWHCHGAAAALPRQCKAIPGHAMGHGIAMPWQWHGVAMALLWHCHRIAMVLL